ncbi:homeobox-leucine zipper protein HOX16-like isoform X2 [Curcuma longa]
MSSTYKRPLFKPIELDDMGEEDGSDDSSHRQEKKKRRMTADQVQFLEKSFELENKLEPDRKFQLAKVLGVEPRQIAIWFQNRRARWRTKQLEKDCEALRSSYGSLKADHECLLKEKQKLEAKVLFLTEKLLLKEGNGGSEPFDLIEHPESSLNAGIKPSSSTILDAGSPPYADEDGYCMLMELTGSANALKLSNFDRSQTGELHDADDYSTFLGFEDLEDNSCSYGLLWS